MVNKEDLTLGTDGKQVGVDRVVSLFATLRGQSGRNEVVEVFLNTLIGNKRRVITQRSHGDGMTLSLGREGEEDRDAAMSVPPPPCVGRNELHGGYYYRQVMS